MGCIVCLCVCVCVCVCGLDFFGSLSRSPPLSCLGGWIGGFAPLPRRYERGRDGMAAD